MSTIVSNGIAERDDGGNIGTGSGHFAGSEYYPVEDVDGVVAGGGERYGRQPQGAEPRCVCCRSI